MRGWNIANVLRVWAVQSIGMLAFLAAVPYPQVFSVWLVWVLVWGVVSSFVWPVRVR
jgi:hypothetical protein